MTKISKKIKYFLILIICMLASLTSCSCSNEYEEMENGVTIRVSDNMQKHMLNTSLPTLHFDYNGVRIKEESSGAACFFVQNDQYKLSDKFAEHLKQYNKDQIFIISEEEQEYDDGKANFGKDKLDLDDFDEFGNKQKYSKEYQIVAVNNDGTRYSYQFRTFVSGGKRYFIFRYSSNMGISMEQSVQVINQNPNKLVLVALPFDTKYEVSLSSLEEEKLIDKDTYTDERYSKYAYPDYLSNYDDQTKQQMIKDWYKLYCNGRDEGNDFVFDYYGVKFKVIFGITDAGVDRNKKGFQLVYMG